MKVRAITIGLHISPEDCADLAFFNKKTTGAYGKIQKIQEALEGLGYTVQTLRLSFNSFEEWLLPATAGDEGGLISKLKDIDMLLKEAGVGFCSFGCATTLAGIRLIPTLLKHCERASCSANLLPISQSSITCTRELSLGAARACLDVVTACGALGAFRFCSSFHCPANIPFFPASFHTGDVSVVTLGLENGGLIFLGCHAARDQDEARRHLALIFAQAYAPLQQTVSSICAELGIDYGGIDASVNPGLSLPDSVAKGMEDLLPAHGNKFGAYGTLSAVATITSAIKDIGNEIKLAGYSGLMLPVMEDLVLAERAAASPPAYSLRDLLLFSSVCGVGLDTVPIPGDTDPRVIAAVYEEVGAMAQKLRKPLSVRLLPLPGLKAGDETNLQSPYLCSTRVFAM